MRNLKKILALVLALAMAFSLVASAATFPDVEPTSATGQAVDLLTGLNIVGGYPDGTFGPEKEITRAEFLKMLFITLNGKDDDGLFGGNSDKFPDVTGDKWFAPYVNWGVQLGIIGGYPDGTFKPDNNVTVAEAAKMIVTALGFDALDYSFPYGFIDKGIQLGIFENVSGIGADDSALRGNIAIMNYNMLFVTSAPRYGTYIPNTGWVYVTPIEKVFGAQKVASEVVATSTNMPALASIDEEGKVALKANNDTENGTQIMGGTYDFTGVDAMLGHAVEVWFINAKGDDGAVMGDKKDDKIVAITDAADQSIVVAASALTTSSAGTGDIKDGDAYATIDGVDTMLFAAVRNLNGTKQKTATGDVMRYFWNEGNSNDNKNWVLNGGASDPAFQVVPRSYNQDYVVFNASIAGAYTFVDNDLTTSDRTVDPWDHVYVNYWRTGKVTNVTSANISIDGINRGGAIPVKQIKGDYSSLVKGDYVNVSVTTGIVDGQVKDIYTIEKAEVLKGATVEARTNRGLRINGTLYLYSYFNGFPDPSPKAVETNNHANVVVGETYDIVLDKGGYIYFYETPEVLPDFMLIESVAVSENTIMGNTYTVTGKLSDGTEKTFELASTLSEIKLGETDKDVIFSTTKEAVEAGITAGWTDATGKANATPTSINAVGKLVQFTTDSEGKIDSMSAIDRTVEIGEKVTYKYDASKKILYTRTDNGAPMIDKTVADNTVFFIYDAGEAGTYKDDKFDVKTGAEMVSFDNTKLALLSTKEDDQSTVEAVLITDDLGAVNGYNTKLAYGTYERATIPNPDNSNEKGFEFKLYVNGQVGTYRTAYYDVSAANKDVAKEYGIINKDLLGTAYEGQPNVNGPIYVEFNEDGTIAHIYGHYVYDNSLKKLTGTTVLTDITAKALNANETAEIERTDNNVYRAAVLDVDATNNIIKFGGVTANGRAAHANEPTYGVVGDYYAKTTTYSYDTFATLPVADDVEIQVLTGTPTAWQNATVSVGSLSDLLESSDAGYSYVADFVLAYKNNNDAEPLEVTQMTFFKYAIGNTVVENISDASSNTELTSFMGQTVTNGQVSERIVVHADTTAITAENVNCKVLVPGAKVTVVDGKLVAGQDNTIKVRVTSKDGTATEDYTFTVYKTKLTVPDDDLSFNVKVSELKAGKLLSRAEIFAGVTIDDVYTDTYTMLAKDTTAAATDDDSKTISITRAPAGLTIKSNGTDFEGGETLTFTCTITPSSGAGIYPDWGAYDQVITVNVTAD